MKLSIVGALAIASLLAAVGVALAASPLPVVTETKLIEPRSPDNPEAKGVADPRCRNGRSAVAGGFVSGVEPAGEGPPPSRQAVVLSSRPDGERWRGTGVANGSDGGKITIAAYCANRRPDSVRSRSVAIPGGETRDLLVRCPKGTRVIGIGHEGEFDVQSTPGGFRVVAAIAYAARLKSARVALIKAAAQTSEDADRGRVTGYAVCSKSPRLVTKTDTVSVAPGEDGNAKAKCPRGSVVAFGGFEQLFPDGGGVGPSTVLDSIRSGDRTWRVRLINSGSSGSPELKARSYAYCAR